MSKSSKKQPAKQTQRRPWTKIRRPGAGVARLWLLIVMLAVLGGLGAAALERQNLYDWWALRNYQAPPIVLQLATQDTMTPYARKIFYVNHPNIETGPNFKNSCPNDGGEKTIVLGCYHAGQSGIFLLSVNDPLLNGVEQVTAAHEMLHSAYERLSGAERQKVDAMLTDYYDHDLHDPRILATIAAYKQSEPHDVVNEMHSVFGTEIADLPSGLEQYYSQYFTDRAAVASFAARYQAEFTSRQTAVAQDDAKLAVQKTQIDSEESDLKSRLAVIDSQQAALNTERSNDDIAAYNAGVPGYNRLVDAYNSEADGLQNLIDQYNQLVTSRNAVALEEDRLASELSSTAPPLTH